MFYKRLLLHKYMSGLSIWKLTTQEMTWWYIVLYVIKEDQCLIMQYKWNYIFFFFVQTFGRGLKKKRILKTHISLPHADSGTHLGLEFKHFMNCFRLFLLPTVSACWDLTSVWVGKMCSISCLSFTSLNSKWTSIWSSYSTV